MRTFTRQILFATAGFILWFAHFNAVYAIHALACARGRGDDAVLGPASVPFAIALVTLAALLGTIWVLIAALRRPASLEAAEPPSAGFMRYLAATSAIGASVAILWSALPAALLAPCA